MYCVACFIFFFIGGLLALLMRTELAAPGLQFLSNEQFNQLFTMARHDHVLFYATPIVFGFANLCCRCRSAHRVAFRVDASRSGCSCSAPRWRSPASITPGGRRLRLEPAYTPLTMPSTSPGVGGDTVDHGYRGWRSPDNPWVRQHDHQP